MKTGTILHHKYFNDVASQNISSKYKEMALEYFNNFGMYGTGIFGMIAKGPNIEIEYDWKNVDLLVDFAKENGVCIHFNTVITGRLDVFPEWYKELDSDKKYQALENHVRAVINRYKGKVSFFKLVNEIVKEDEENFLGTEMKKTDVIADIFKWAIDEYPEGRYMINEYGCLIREEIRKPFLILVDNIKKLGGRIDIIGEQAHSGYYPRPFFLPTTESLNRVLDEIHDSAKLPLIITEFDIGPKNGDYEGGSINPEQEVVCDGISYPTWYEYQGYSYRLFKELCTEKGYVEELYFWNMIDDKSMTWERNGTGLFDENIDLKKHMLELLKELKKEKDL